MQAFCHAHAAKVEPQTGTLQSVLNTYQESPKFKALPPRTWRDYIQQIRKIEKRHHDFPLAALSEREARSEFLSWRDNLAKKSKRQADYSYSVLALIISWAFDRGLVPGNPCERPGKVYRSDRIDSVWTNEDEVAFLKAAPPHIGLAFILAIWVGQRQGGLLRLPWSAYDGISIRLRQRKGKKHVTLPVGAPLKTVLDATNRIAETILATTRNTPWTERGFRSSWRTACKAAGVEGLTFHDLRGTTVTRLTIAGCSVPEIAAITGHRLKHVETILDSHYLSRDSAPSVSAIRKLEAHEARTKIPT